MWLANVQQFFPDKAPTQLWNDYSTWLKNRSQFQQLYQHYPLTRLCEANFSGMDTKSDGGILITFHFGPYRLLPKILVRCGYSVTLLAASHILAREAEYYAAELREAGLPSEILECIDANHPYSLRKILSAVNEKRLILVFLDADEGQQHADANVPDKLPVPFAAHYFQWRTNILKLAARFRIPVNCTFMQRCEGQIPWIVHPFESIISDDKHTSEDVMMRAFSRLQLVFQQMMKQGWIYWENWAFIHQYNTVLPDVSKGITAAGSWLLPLEYQKEKYLFDVKNRQFFKIKG
jgi:hypothetical protein